ncbi:MAG: helix-turn-helix domain-containing protein [Gammaproteobacteria bacterium]|nr:helix-turn-helix domain-containing protein [Gammaproteobacteria bacterium]
MSKIEASVKGVDKLIHIVFNEDMMAKQKTLGDVNSMRAREIKKRRVAAGMNQRELADAVGVSQPTVCRWEQGLQPIPPYAAKLITIVTAEIPAKSA